MGAGLGDVARRLYLTDTYVRLAEGWAIQTTKITRLALDRD